RARQEGLSLPLELSLVAYGGVLLRDGRWSEARDSHVECARICLEEGLSTELPIVVMNIAVLEVLLGNTRAAFVALRRAARLARAHDPRTFAGIRRTAAAANRVAGRGRRAARWAERAVSTAQRSGREEDLVWARIELARVAIQFSGWEEARRVLDAGLAGWHSAEPNALA